MGHFEKDSFWLDKGGEVRYVLLYGARHVSR
jgi:hypothetical protein